MEANKTLVFTYGTLKQNFPNYPLIQSLMERNDAVYMGTCTTTSPYPLVIGPHGIPFLINVPGEGKRVVGDLYALTDRGLALVDELEGTSRGHYQRLALEVAVNGHEGARVVFAYFAGSGFGERLWEKRGRVGLSEYGIADSYDYVGVEVRAKGSSFLADMELFLS